MGFRRLRMKAGRIITTVRRPSTRLPIPAWTSISGCSAVIALLLLLAPVPSVQATEPGWRRADVLERGAEVYSRQCAGCHGIHGDGQGEAAALLYPKPRDFVAAEYKFSSRPTPGLPTDDDLRQVIREGLQGTAMTGFPLMAEGDVSALVAYLKTFSERWEEPQSPPIAIPEDPWAGREAEGIERGREVYHVEAVCLSCHPSYLDARGVESLSERLGYPAIPLREDAHLAIPKETDTGSLVFPPDFRRDRIKTGDDLANLYRVISAGITTTAMPTWDGILQPDQLWGLAHYIRSLSRARPVRVEPAAYRPRPPVDPSIPPVSVPEEVFEAPFVETTPGGESGPETGSEETAAAPSEAPAQAAPPTTAAEATTATETAATSPAAMTDVVTSPTAAGDAPTPSAEATAP